MPTSTQTAPAFGSHLRTWRNFRRLSQLELSLRADISQRHLSWLETGRSRPSRRMVVLLSEALDMPLRDRNRLLNAAGFVSIYRERGLDEEQMDAVRGALTRMLDHQMPYPGLVIDRHWNLLMTNRCADALLDAVGGEALWEEIGSPEQNLAVLTLHPKGLRPWISNWDQAAHAFLLRLRRDLDRTSDPELRAQIEALIQLAGNPSLAEDPPSTELLPMLSLDLQLGTQTLRLFSVISTFGTAQDVTAEELRIESFFPLDPESEAILHQLAGT